MKTRDPIERAFKTLTTHASEQINLSVQAFLDKRPEEGRQIVEGLRSKLAPILGWAVSLSTKGKDQAPNQEVSTDGLMMNPLMPESTGKPEIPEKTESLQLTVRLMNLLEERDALGEVKDRDDIMALNHLLLSALKFMGDEQDLLRLIQVFIHFENDFNNPRIVSKIQEAYHLRVRDVGPFALDLLSRKKEWQNTRNPASLLLMAKTVRLATRAGMPEEQLDEYKDQVLHRLQLIMAHPPSLNDFKWEIEVAAEFVKSLLDYREILMILGLDPKKNEPYQEAVNKFIDFFEIFSGGRLRTQDKSVLAHYFLELKKAGADGLALARKYDLENEYKSLSDRRN